MKTLFLVRHAKSSWDHPGISDFDRPLMEKGISKTKRIITFLNERQIIIDLMISSPAKRAIETAYLVSKGLQYPMEKIMLERKIYEGSYDRILDIVYSTSDNVDKLMIVGHNPTITQVANLFIHPGIDYLPTSGIVAISFQTEKWEKVPTSEKKQEFLIFPKMLKK